MRRPAQPRPSATTSSAASLTNGPRHIMTPQAAILGARWWHLVEPNEARHVLRFEVPDSLASGLLYKSARHVQTAFETTVQRSRRPHRTRPSARGDRIGCNLPGLPLIRCHSMSRPPAPTATVSLPPFERTDATRASGSQTLIGSVALFTSLPLVTARPIISRVSSTQSTSSKAELWLSRGTATPRPPYCWCCCGRAERRLCMRMRTPRGRTMVPLCAETRVTCVE